jgi:hypothetical protein
MVVGGQIDEVSRCCDSDVVNTYRVWLVYELFCGAITAEELDWSECKSAISFALVERLIFTLTRRWHFEPLTSPHRIAALSMKRIDWVRGDKPRTDDAGLVVPMARC